MVKTKQAIRVLMADEHTIFRQGVRKLLECEDDISIVGEAANGNECIAMMAKFKPDILLLDINMPDKDGLAVLNKLRFLAHAGHCANGAGRRPRRRASDTSWCSRHCSEAIGERSSGQEHPPGLRRRDLVG